MHALADMAWLAALGAAGTAIVAAAMASLRQRTSCIERLTLLGGIAAEPWRTPPRPAIAASLRRLADFFAADDCIALFPGQPSHDIVAAGAGGEAIGTRLLAVPENCAIVWRRHPLSIPGRCMTQLGLSAAAPRDCPGPPATMRALDLALGVPEWIGVPFDAQDGIGRLCLVAPRRHLGVDDIGLLRQAGAAMAMRLSAYRRLEQDALDAARRERSRISLDLHDSAIQPYLGLKLALEALERKAAPANPLSRDLHDLARMTQESIDELRGYVRVLDGRAGAGGDLREGVQRQAERFGRLYGIDIETHIGRNVAVEPVLAAELVRMIGESLSNVGRHTTSQRVTVDVDVREGRLLAEVVDQGAGLAWRAFEPESLQRRACALGGAVAVMPRGTGSALTFSIPLAVSP